jgi:RNA polymerase sigma-70 factor, ECF subfamily
VIGYLDAGGLVTREVNAAQAALAAGLSLLRSSITDILSPAVRGGGATRRTRSRSHTTDAPGRHTPAGNGKPVGGRIGPPPRPPGSPKPSRDEPPPDEGSAEDADACAVDADKAVIPAAPAAKDSSDTAAIPAVASGDDPSDTVVIPVVPSRDDPTDTAVIPVVPSRDESTDTAVIPAVPATDQPAAGPAGGSPGRPDPSDPATEVWSLVERAQAGEAEAFGLIYDRYVDTVFRFVYFRVGNRQLAEDLTSDTFLRALKRIGSFTWQGRDLGAWLVTIARNLVADHFKSGRYRLEVTTGDVLDADREDRGPEGSPEAAVVDHITNVALLTAVKQLNPEQQECIVLRFLQGFSVAETAQAMGKNEGAIKALQYRAVRALARLLPDGFQP